MPNLNHRWARWAGLASLAGVSCFAGLLSSLWCGLLLAGAGLFVSWAPWLAGLAGCCAAFLRYRGTFPEHDNTSSRDGVGLAAVLVLSLLTLALTLPPSEWITGGWDPGVYLHTAAALQKGGSLRLDYPDLAGMDSVARSLFGRDYYGVWEPFLGMRMTVAGWISPQFYHAYPVLMATAWPLGGARAALWINPLLNVACVIALYLWASGMLGRKWGFAAAAVLALNPAQVWQARFSTSEMLTQFLLLGGLALLAKSTSVPGRLASACATGGRGTSGADAILGGAALGLALMTRYDAIMFVVPFLLVLIWGLRDPARRPALFRALSVIAVFGIHCRLHGKFLAPFYNPMAGRVAAGLAGAAVLSVAVALAAMLIPNHRVTGVDSALPRPLRGLRTEGLAPLQAKAPRWEHMVRIGAAAAFVAWLVFSWYLRPRLGVDGRVLAACAALYPSLQQASWFPELAGRDALNILYLVSLFGGLGLVAAAAGVVWLIMRVRSLTSCAWLIASCGVMAMLMMRIYHEPFMMFAARRLVPVVVPLLCVGVAAACAGVEQLLRKRPRAALLTAGLLMALAVGGTLRSTAMMARHREWPGLVAWFDALAARLPADARVVSDQPGFAAPLRFIYGFRAYETAACGRGARAGVKSSAQRPRNGRGEADSTLARLEKLPRGGPLYLLTTREPSAAVLQRAELVDSIPLQSCILGTARHAVPLEQYARGGKFRLYRIRASQPAPEP